MRDQHEKNELALRFIDLFLNFALIGAVIPFLTMFVWNTLVVGLFGAFTIGYGGAWVVMILRAFFLRKSNTMPKDEVTEIDELFRRTSQQYMLAALTAVAVLILGLSMGYM